MKNIKINYISILFLLAFISISYYYLFRRPSGESEYGKDANKIREHVMVPVIEADMRKIRTSNNTEGGRWETKNESGKNDLIHLWKIVSPYNGNYLLNEESDAFKKHKDKEAYWQLNIYSKILGDSASIRNGILRLQSDGRTINQQNLDEGGLDSVFEQWGLRRLIKKS